MSARIFIAGVLSCLAGLAATASTDGADWSRFRGPHGAGVVDEENRPPVEFNETKNLKWKASLPGPGSSSPIIIGDKVFVTCWSGYGTDQRDPGSPSDLKRHLVCLDRHDGKVLWDQAVPAALPEDTYRGMFAEHGYATHTPVSDGESVFAFFGKSGVYAFDLDGNQLWRANVGDGLDGRGWGSASSPILYENLLIVPAVVESYSLIAFDKKSGKRVWDQEADGFGSTWGTPILVDLPDGTVELVFAVPFELWGFDPATGKLKWYCDGVESDSICSSAIAHDGVVYAIEAGPRGGGAVAVRTGGKDDVSDSHVVWRTRDRSRIGTPIFHDGRLYWVSSKIANCIDAATGERVYQERLSSPGGTPSAGESNDRSSRGGGRGRGGQDYSSPIAAGDVMYYVTRSGDAYVVQLGAEFKQLAVNRIADGGDFSATPAISDGDLFIRSSKNLYCFATSE